MATNLNISTNSTTVSSNNFSITVTDNNTGNVVNISPPTNPIVSISAAGILGNPGKDSDVIAGESVIFQHITASGEISASGIVYGSQINIGGGIFTSASLAAAEASGDNLGDHTATQNLNLDGNSLFSVLNITASGNISSSKIDVGNVSGISSLFDLRVGDGGVRTSGTGYFTGITNPGTYSGGGRIILSADDAYIETLSYISASRYVSTQHITASGNVSASGDLSITGESFFGSHITASGDISSSKSIIANTLTVDSISSSNIVLPESNNSTLTLFSDQTDKAAFLLNGRSNMDSYLSVLSGQKLGIGLAVDEVPSSKLTISGDLKVSSHITASGNVSASGNLNAANITTPGTLTVGHLEATTINTLQLTSSIVTSSIIFSSGSNIFGDEASDTHTFIGSITASSNISASKLITALTGSFVTGSFSYIQGNSPLTINPDQLIVTPNDYFQVLTGGTTSSIFISQSSGNIGFNTDDPQTGFDAIVNEAQFQKPGTRTGLRINNEGNIESFSKDANTAATGSEFVLRYSRGVSITQASLAAINISVEDNAAATQYFNSLQPKEQNAVLEKLESEGFITPPQVNDVLGSIRFIAESGSSAAGEGYDDRSTGETAVIKAVVSEGDATGIQADMIFSVAGKTGGAVQQFLLDAEGEHQMTGSLSLDNVKINGVLQSITNQNSTIGFDATSGDQDIEFKPNGTNMLTLAPDLVNFNSGYANADFRVNGSSGVQAALGNIFIFGDASADGGKGHLGVGTGSPTERLHVVGNIKASGDLTVSNINGTINGGTF